MNLLTMATELSRDPSSKKRSRDDITQADKVLKLRTRVSLLLCRSIEKIAKNTTQ